MKLFTLKDVDLIIMNLLQFSYRFAMSLLTYFSLLELFFSVLKLAGDLTKHLSMCNIKHASVVTDFSRTVRC